jgi:hypothetical protein
MTELDKALENMRHDQEDAAHQSKFYDLFLNSGFFVPTLDKLPGEAGDEALAEGQVLPLVMESDGNDYLMLFDTEERLKAWSQPGVKWVEVPGYVLAETTMAPLHWALNVGTDYAKQFVPEEIAWLRDVVERCNAAAAGQEGSPAP